MTRIAPLLLLTCVLAVFPGCGRGCGSQPVAVVSTAQGTVQRDTLEAIEVWLAAPVDTRASA